MLGSVNVDARCGRSTIGVHVTGERHAHSTLWQLGNRWALNAFSFIVLGFLSQNLVLLVQVSSRVYVC